MLQVPLLPHPRTLVRAVSATELHHRWGAHQLLVVPTASTCPGSNRYLVSLLALSLAYTWPACWLCFQITHGWCAGFVSSIPVAIVLTLFFQHIRGQRAGFVSRLHSQHARGKRADFFSYTWPACWLCFQNTGSQRASWLVFLLCFQLIRGQRPGFVSSINWLAF